MDNQNIITLAINPKEYFEVYKSKEINKKHKGLKKISWAWILKVLHLELWTLENLLINKKKLKNSPKEVSDNKIHQNAYD